MAEQQIEVDGSLLDNDNWRFCVGPLAILRDATGAQDTIAQEFVIQVDAGAYDPDVLATRYKATLDAFSKTNPRIKAWFDDDGDEVADWHSGDATHSEIETSISMLPEFSVTGKKLHCIFEASARVDKFESTDGGPTAGGMANVVGLVGSLQIGTVYFDSRKYTKAVTARFGPTWDASAFGPFTLASVSNQSGKARFTMSGAHSIPLTEVGLKLIVTGSTNYNGTHIVTAIGATYFDTQTAYVSNDTGTVVVGQITSGRANYEASRDDLLETFLETAAGGAPGPEGMVLANEQIAEDNQRGEYVDVQMTSIPQASVSGVVDSSGESVERGLTYLVTYDEPEVWDRTLSEVVYPASIKGQVSINLDALVAQGQKAWFDQVAATVLTKAENELTLGAVTEMGRVVSFDFATLSCSFDISIACGYNGTASYSQSVAYALEHTYQIWEDTDGFDHVQKSNAEPRKSCTITVTRSGEGIIDLTPQPPEAEGAFQWLLVKHAISRNRNPLQTPFSNNFYSQNEEFTYVRIKPRSGSVGQAGQGGGSSVIT